MDQPTAERALADLQPFVGEWELSATGPDGAPWPGTGGAAFSWHESGAHLVERSWTDGPAPDGVSIMGCDAANGRYVQLYSDDRGVCRVYEMGFAAGRWTLERTGEPFPQRFTATMSEDGQTIEGRWEKAEDGSTFTTDFHLTYRRRDATS
jgi:hypothetical protein